MGISFDSKIKQEGGGNQIFFLFHHENIFCWYSLELPY